MEDYTVLSGSAKNERRFDLARRVRPIRLVQIAESNTFKNNLREDHSIAETFDCIKDFNAGTATFAS